MSRALDSAAERFIENVDYVEDAFYRYGGAVLHYNAVIERIGDKALRPFYPSFIKAEGRMLGEVLRLSGLMVVLMPSVILDRRRIEASTLSESLMLPPYETAETILANRT